MILGNRPVGTIDIPTYRNRLAKCGKKVLSEESFVEELVYAHMCSPCRCKNGMQLWRSEDETGKMIDYIAETSGTGSNVMLIVLDPAGKHLF